MLPGVADGVEFDWDDENIRHLKRHRVTTNEFEEVIMNEPLDLEYQTERGEPRYKSLGGTNQGRILIAVWTVREGRIRPITAYRASKPYRELYTRFRS